MPCSLQKDFRRMNEHRKRIHGAIGLTKEEFENLESCEAWKPTEKCSFRAVDRAKTSLEVGVDFRMESLFESKVGLLKSSIIFFEGEEMRLGADCLRYFNNYEAPNPYKAEVIAFLRTANTLCSRVGSELCRQQAMRNAEGVTTSACFRPIQSAALYKYAAIVAHLVYFVTKCPWDHPTAVNLTDVPSILHAIFFEPRISIQQNFMTR
jgi:hypothetical protein